MRFHPTGEQDAITDAVRGTLKDRWMPRLRAFVDNGERFDPESWGALMELGLGGIMVPEEKGGSGLALVEAALVMEVAGACAFAGPLAEQMGGAALLADRAGNVPAEAIARTISGDAVVTFALGAEWHPDSWDVKLAGGRANGAVRFVRAGEQAQFFIVGTTGGGLALVEKDEGVTIELVNGSDPTRSLASVRFDDAPAIPLCEPGDGRAHAVYDAMVVLSAAESLGAAQQCLDMTVDYAKERVQFDQPIGKFQALKHQIADLAMDVEPARALLWYAAHAHDADLPDRRRAAAIAKAHIVDRLESVARGSVAAHGGIGYTWEHALNIWFRRFLFDHAWLGTPAQHRARAAELAW